MSLTIYIRKIIAIDYCRKSKDLNNEPTSFVSEIAYAEADQV